jgi:hypothetical protein
MSFYVVESYDFQVEHGGRKSRGAGPLSAGSEKLYLHVLPLTDDEVRKLAAREDDDGNKDHARLCLPRTPEWWIALDGEVAWPGIFRPKITSRCEAADGPPRPVALSPESIAALKKAGVAGL